MAGESSSVAVPDEPHVESLLPSPLPESCEGLSSLLSDLCSLSLRSLLFLSSLSLLSLFLCVSLPSRCLSLSLLCLSLSSRCLSLSLCFLRSLCLSLLCFTSLSSFCSSPFNFSFLSLSFSVLLLNVVLKSTKSSERKSWYVLNYLVSELKQIHLKPIPTHYRCIHEKLRSKQR